MTLAAFALILLSASYVWLRRWRLSRSHLLRIDGHALYFIVVAASVPAAIWTGSILQAVAHLLGEPMLPQDIASSLLGKLVASEKGSPQLVLFGLIAIVAVPAAMVHAWLLNLPIPFRSGLTARLLLRMGSIEELERFLWDTNERSLSVMITTSSGKVYVGNCLELPTGAGERKYVRLEPLLSGYRDEKQSFKPTTTYEWIAELPKDASLSNGSLCKRDFDILIPTETISSVHSFDLKTYVVRYAETTEQSTEQSSEKGVVDASDGPDLLSAEVAGPVDDVTPLRTQATRAEIAYLLYFLAILVVPPLFAKDHTGFGLVTLGMGLLCGIGTYIASYEGADSSLSGMTWKKLVSRFRPGKLSVRS